MLILKSFVQALFSVSRFTKSRAILTIAKSSATLPNSFDLLLSKRNSSASMDQVFKNFDSLWTKSLVDQSDKKTSCQSFHKARLDSLLYYDMLDYLKKEFYNLEQNIYEAHILLVEASMNNKNCPYKHAQAAFINQAFIEFRNQQQNICKRQSAAAERDIKHAHLILACRKTNECLCTKSDSTIVRAFKMASTDLTILSSFNKIYNFNKNIEHLQTILTEYFNSSKKVSYSEKAILIGELQIYDTFPLDQIVLPLMLLDKYTSIDNYINRNEEILLKVVEFCDDLCDPNKNLKEIALSQKNSFKKTDKFKAKIIAKYASTCLKRINKSNLIRIKYKNIGVQLKVSQLRFLVNLRYDKWNADPISFEAWQELVVDLVGEDELLQNKLFLELIQYQKDVKTAFKFLKVFGFENNLLRLPESTRDFYTKNIELFDLVNEDESILNLKSDYYYPHEYLSEKNIYFVGSSENFEEMLNFFNATSPQIIGLDCEWKPSFDLIDTSNENDLRNHASTFQIATRDRCYVIDIKFLIPKLETSLIEKFGQLILFNEDILKLGYNFKQDATKLLLSFPNFVHKFNEFSENVINIDERLTELQKKHNFFTEIPEPTGSKEKKLKGSKGLSELTRKCFGAPLNKSECLSNWDRRPLRAAQLEYCALDSYVLIQIHDYFQEKCKILGTDFLNRSK